MSALYRKNNIGSNTEPWWPLLLTMQHLLNMSQMFKPLTQSNAHWTIRHHWALT